MKNSVSKWFLTSWGDKMSHKKFNPLVSPYHLIYMTEELGMASRSFDDLEILCKFIGELGLSRYDYIILHGEMVKDIPKDIVHEQFDRICDDGPSSAIMTLAPSDIQALVESHQI